MNQITDILPYHILHRFASPSVELLFRQGETVFLAGPVPRHPVSRHGIDQSAIAVEDEALEIVFVDGMAG